MTTRSVFSLREVTKARAPGDGPGFVLRVPALDIAAGESVAILGVSGSGKSTLLDLLGLALSPSGAEGFVFTPETEADTDIAALWRANDLDGLGLLRRHHLGYVLQTGGLLPFLTVAGNIDLSRHLLGLPEDGSVERLAERLGIARYLRKHPRDLSAGERQRVAIARALAHAPPVILADEPTAALDPLTAGTVMALFLELVEQAGATAIVASHDHARIEALGLRRLEHALERDAATGAVLSRYWG